MNKHKLEQIIAIHDGVDLICIECVDCGRLADVNVEVYEESDRKEEEIMICDLCGKMI